MKTEKDRLAEACAAADSQLFWTPILLAVHQQSMAAHIAIMQRDRALQEAEWRKKDDERWNLLLGIKP